MKSALKRLLYKLFRLLPIDSKLITFESFSGKKFGGNPKAIYDEMKKRNLNFKYIWFMDKSANIKNIPRDEMVYKGTIKWIYYTARSKIWIKNTGSYGSLSKRKGQIYINTWHSGGTLKKQGYEIENIPINNRKPKINVKDWDWYVAGSKEKADEMIKSYGYKGNVIVNGMPRIDELLNVDKTKIKNIKKRLNVDNKKVILYAPTFRDQDLDGKKNNEVLTGIEIPKDYVLLVKFHPHVKWTDLKRKDIINVSNYNSLNELFIISDLLITDYSTVIFDYSNLNRPVILYAYDLVDYKKKRGFGLDYEREMPGPIVRTTEELNKELKRIKTISTRYKKKMENFYNKYCLFNDGQATKRFIEMFENGFFEEGKDTNDM